MAYCTVAEAKAAGATGSDAEVAAAIAAAERLIDTYAGTTWEVRTLTLVARVEADGMVFLPFVVQSVTSVTPVGAAAPLPASAYLVLSSTTLGQVDAVLIGGQGLSDPLVLGAEPWAGGYAHLLSGARTGQVAVAGSFGPTQTPLEVHDAAVALAAWRAQAGSVATAPAAVQVDDEGDTVSVVLSVEQATARSRTTGLEAMDALLSHLVRDPIRLG